MTAIVLDARKLLGFRLYATAAEATAGSAGTAKAGAKIGAKAGLKPS